MDLMVLLPKRLAHIWRNILVPVDAAAASRFAGVLWCATLCHLHFPFFEPNC
jgi:hypothetical protein